MKYSRRNFIAKTLGATALIAATGKSSATQLTESPFNEPIYGESSVALSNIHVFSKMLHWLDYESLAAFAREAGFDGVDLTVRPKGHVSPERVAEDLPRAVETIKKAGLKVDMITTSITKADEPHAGAILSSASAAGVKHYRMGWIQYDRKISIKENLRVITKQLQKLAALNARYKIKGEYQNHSGEDFGAAVWDLFGVLEKVNSPWLGSQYDLYHATVEGANAWPVGLELVKPYIGTIDIKDFVWSVRDGVQARRDVPLGTGHVNFRRFFDTIRTAGINVPISLHIEYDLGGAESGATRTSMSREKIMEIMKTDLAALKAYLA